MENILIEAEKAITEVEMLPQKVSLLFNNLQVEEAVEKTNAEIQHILNAKKKQKMQKKQKNIWKMKSKMPYTVVQQKE